MIVVKKYLQIVTGLILLSTVVIAQARASMPAGWYVEGNVGKARTRDISYGAGTTISNEGIAWNVNVGYKIIPYFGVEAGYTNYAKTEAKFAGTKIASDKHYSVYAAAKGIMPLGESGFELFAKWGLSSVRSNATIGDEAVIAANGLVVNSGKSTGGGYFVGVGADYVWMPNVLLNAQWHRARGNNQTGRMDLYSIGIGYIFT